jgi:hypothetical protein
VAAEGASERDVVGDGEQGVAGGNGAGEEAGDLVAESGVEALGRLVGEEKRGAAGAGGGEGDALGHAAGKLARQAGLRAREAEGDEVGGGGGAGGAAGEAGDVGVGLAHLGAGAHGGVEGAPWLLGEHGDAAAPEGAAGAGGEGVEALAVEEDPACRGEAGRQGAEDRLGEEALSGAGLAEDRQGCSGGGGEGDGADERAVRAADGEGVGGEGRRHGAILRARSWRAAIVRVRQAMGWRMSQGASRQ